MERMLQEASNEGITLFVPPGKGLLACVGCSLFAAGMIWFAMSSYDSNWVDAVLGLPAALLFGWIALCWLYLVLARVPILVINEDGIQIPRALSAFGAWLKWEEIEIITVTKRSFIVSFSVSVTVSPQERPAFLSRQSWLWRWVQRPFVRIGPGRYIAIQCPTWYFPLSADQLLKQIQEQYHPQLEQYQITIG